MDPSLLRGNLALALFILLLALLILPFQDRSSGGFVVTVLAAVVALVFVGLVALLARWSVPRVPREMSEREDDKQARTGYNDQSRGKPASALSPRAKERDDV